MLSNLKVLHVLCFFLYVSAFSRDLSKEAYDISDPKSRIPLPVGQAQDVYVHYDIDPTLISAGHEQEIVNYLMTLTDIMNRETFNAVEFNLVASSFSINSKNTDRSAMLELQTLKPLREEESHIWVHVTDYLASSIAGRFDLYTGEDRSYVIAATFDGEHYTHSERANVARMIGHLFGLDYTHVLSISYHDDGVIEPDYCGGGPNGAECSTKPAIGGSLMSRCQECPNLNGGSFYSAKPLTSFHPYQAEKIQEHYDDSKERLANIQRQKLRTSIPKEAESNICANEDEMCSCNGVVYFGPTISSGNPRIFGVEHVTGSVRCASGAEEKFADVFHGAQKSCYCDEGADLHDITYTPIDVEFTKGGTGECVVEGCGTTKQCSWNEYDGPQDIGYFTISGQPEWKCKQECLDRTQCNAYNFKDGHCRLFQNQPSTTSDSGIFSGSTCWVRPTFDEARYLQPAYQIRDIITGIPDEDSETTDEDSVKDVQYTMLNNEAVCANEASLIENEADCFHAISELGLETMEEPWVDFMPTGKEKKPAGCSFDSSKGMAHFNENLKDGVGLGHMNLAPICKVIYENAQWSKWSSWSTCSRKCGGGMQTQLRTCLSGNCVGANSRTKTCNNHACSGSGSPTCEFVAIPSDECPEKHDELPSCGNASPESLCEADFAQNGVAIVINNCGDSDVFRYICI